MSDFNVGQSICILVVEDDPAVATSLQAGLEREGYTVVWVSTGSGGVSYAREQHPHLILLDIRLPDLSGLDACRQIRQLGLVHFGKLLIEYLYIARSWGIKTSDNIKQSGLTGAGATFERRKYAYWNI